MVVTRPLGSINASMRTLPETCWLLASVGYDGGTEEISFACFTSPPTGSGAAGAEGCLLSPTRPALSASALDSGCSSLFKTRPASTSPLFCVLRFGVTFGAARWTLPRTGFFGCSTATTAGADVAAAAPPLAGFDGGCELCDVAATDLPAGTTLSVFEVELDGAEVLVSATGFVWGSAFVCGIAFP